MSMMNKDFEFEDGLNLMLKTLEKINKSYSPVIRDPKVKSKPKISSLTRS